MLWGSRFFDCIEATIGPHNHTSFYNCGGKWLSRIRSSWSSSRLTSMAFVVTHFDGEGELSQAIFGCHMGLEVFLHYFLFQKRAALCLRTTIDQPSHTQVAADWGGQMMFDRPAFVGGVSARAEAEQFHFKLWDLHIMVHCFFPIIKVRKPACAGWHPKQLCAIHDVLRTVCPRVIGLAFATREFVSFIFSLNHLFRSKKMVQCTPDICAPTDQAQRLRWFWADSYKFSLAIKLWLLCHRLVILGPSPWFFFFFSHAVHFSLAAQMEDDQGLGSGTGCWMLLTLSLHKVWCQNCSAREAGAEATVVLLGLVFWRVTVIQTGSVSLKPPTRDGGQIFIWPICHGFEDSPQSE